MCGEVKENTSGQFVIIFDLPWFFFGYRAYDGDDENENYFHFFDIICH